MRIISWNVNGLMPKLVNSMIDPIRDLVPDIVCFQETRTNERPEVIPSFHHEWNSSQRSEYAGVLTSSRVKPLGVQYGVGDAALDQEGRLLTMEFEHFYSVNAYFPRTHSGIARHKYRMRWDSVLKNKLLQLDQRKPVILCGDFNVTRSTLDVYSENERQARAESGYISEERESLEELLESGFTDAFRSLYPDLPGAYTWWSNRLNKRSENRGWRLDYFCVSDRIVPLIKKVRHLTDIIGSDHCPIFLEITL